MYFHCPGVTWTLSYESPNTGMPIYGKVRRTSFTNFANTHQAKSHFNLFGLLHLWRLFQTRSQSAIKWTRCLASIGSDQVEFRKTVKIIAIYAVNIFLWEVQLVETVLSNKVQSEPSDNPEVPGISPTLITWICFTVAPFSNPRPHFVN